MRLATTAGATVLTFVALGGMAQADPVGDTTDGLTDTLGGVTDSVTDGVTDTVTGGAVRLPSPLTSSSRPGDGGAPLIAVRLRGPVHVNTKVKLGSSPGNGTQADVSLDAGVRLPSGRGDLLRASVGVGVDTCGFAPEECGLTGAPPPVAPPAAPPGSGAPPATPPGVGGPTGAGPSAPGAAASTSSMMKMKRTLPFTGGPLGALTTAGLAAVVTGSAAVAGSRFRFSRDPR
jgi:hypothetical protein